MKWFTHNRVDKFILYFTYTVLTIKLLFTVIFSHCVRAQSVVMNVSVYMSIKVMFSHTHYRALGPQLIPVYRQSAHR